MTAYGRVQAHKPRKTEPTLDKVTLKSWCTEIGINIAVFVHNLLLPVEGYALTNE